MKYACLDLQKTPTEAFLDEPPSAGSESFIHKKYTEGCPNNSLASTTEGMLSAFSRLMPQRDDDAFFGTHIKETIAQFRALFSGNDK